MLRQISATLILFVSPLLAGHALAANEEFPKDFAGSMARARQLTDIAAQDSSFQITGRVKLRSLTTSDVDGAYSKIWAPQQRWREEIKIRDYVSIVVKDATKRWELTNAKYPPLRIHQLRQLLDTLNRFPPADASKYQRREEKEHGQKLVCFRSSGSDQEYCFDSAIGTLVRYKIKYFRAEYSDYGPIGTKLYPRSLRAFQESLPTAEVEILQAVPANAVAADFLPPLGAEEDPASNCHERVPDEQARLLTKVAPSYPSDAKALREQGTVVLAGIIDKTGVPHLAGVLESAGPRLNKAAIDAVQQWRYKPMFLCGFPVDVETMITVRFNLVGN